MNTSDPKCTCSCQGYVDRWGHTETCPRAPRVPLMDWLVGAVCVIVFAMVYFGFAAVILLTYASWGGSCLENGGHIVGSGFDTRCEGMKRQ